MTEIVNRQKIVPTVVSTSFDLDKELDKAIPTLTEYVDPPFNPDELIKAREIIADEMRTRGPCDEWPVEFIVDPRGRSLGMRVRDEKAWNEMRNSLFYRQFM